MLLIKRETIIPKAAVARILMRNGAERVSQSGTDAFTRVLTDIAEEISAKAVRVAQHSGRKTVHEKDIKLASE